MQPLVRGGLDVLQDQGFASLRGSRVGLVTHPAAVNRHLQHAADLFSTHTRLTALLGPEHGFLGEAQDLIGVADQQDTTIGMRVYSLYGDTFASLKPTGEQLANVDVLVIDMQDIGSRYYTFQATMLLCLEAASEHKKPVIILDRPNPLDGVAVEGPTLRAGFESFVGLHPVAIRHGLTMGELARLYRAERNFTCELTIIPCEGWQRRMTFDQTGLPWVLPSPNMPTLETAFVYPGQCLLEGTNFSEGRGTTRPFEWCGAPWIDAKALVRRLTKESLPGVVFRPAWMRPTFHKFVGQNCGGVQLHVVDRDAFLPVRTGLAVVAVMRELSGDHFRWRTERYEFVDDKPAVDLLFGSARERMALDANRSVQEISQEWIGEEEDFRERRKASLLY